MKTSKLMFHFILAFLLTSCPDKNNKPDNEVDPRLTKGLSEGADRLTKIKIPLITIPDIGNIKQKKEEK